MCSDAYENTRSSNLLLPINIPQLHHSVCAPGKNAVEILFKGRTVAFETLCSTCFRPAHAANSLLARLRAHLGDHLFVLDRYLSQQRQTLRAATFALPDDIGGRNSQSISVSSAPRTYEFSSHFGRKFADFS